MCVECLRSRSLPPYRTIKEGERFYIELASMKTVIRFYKRVELGAPLML